ncbi:MAG: B12-binding domain-containing radical SAM protein [Promethearchaeota archaeon]
MKKPSSEIIKTSETSETSETFETSKTPQTSANVVNIAPTKVLLLNMPDTIIGFNLAARLPNLGLASIAANIDPNEADIKIVDLVLCRHALKRCLVKILNKVEPEIVGISCMIFQYHTARNIAKFIKEEYNSDIKIVFGGYFPTVSYDLFGKNYNIPKLKNEKLRQIDGPSDEELDSINQNPWCDFIVRGEGEETFREFIHAYRNNLGYDGILGLSWKDENGYFHHNERRPNLDLSKLKLPNRDARLINGFHIVGKPAALVETSRGCTNACKFCSIATMYGRVIRYYDLDRVMEDLNNCKKRGIKAVLFIDDNITINPKRFEELCDRIIKAKLNMDFHVQASVVGLLSRPNLIKKMGKAGFSIVFFGIENVDPRNLRFFKKSVPLKKLKYLVKELHKNGMLSFGGFVLGSPNDDLKSFDYNLRFAKYLNLDIAAWQILTPFPKTETREELLNMGLITNLNDFSKYNGITANVRTKRMTSQQMNKALIKTYERYYTPAWLLRKLFQPHLWRYFPYAFMVLLKIARYLLPNWTKWFFKLVLKSKGRDLEESILQDFNRARYSRQKLVKI